jgi:integrase
MLYRRAEAAGLDPSRAHPHMFRKFFATQWLRARGDEERLMLVGGWATKEALEHYLDLARLGDVEAAHRAYGHMGRLTRCYWIGRMIADLT